MLCCLLMKNLIFSIYYVTKRENKLVYGSQLLLLTYY